MTALQLPYEAGPIFPVLQMRKMRLREVMLLPNQAQKRTFKAVLSALTHSSGSPLHPLSESTQQSALYSVPTHNY